MVEEHSVHNMVVLRDKCRDLFQWASQLPGDQRTEALNMLEQLLNSVVALYTGHRLKVVKFSLESSQSDGHTFELASLAQVLLLAGCVQPGVPMESSKEESLLPTESPQQTMPAFEYSVSDYCGSVCPERPVDPGCLSSVEDDGSRLDSTCARLDALVDLASKLAGADKHVMEQCASVAPTINLTVPVTHNPTDTWPHVNVVTSLQQVALGRPEPSNAAMEENQEENLAPEETSSFMQQEGETGEVNKIETDDSGKVEPGERQDISGDEVWKPNSAEELALEESEEEEEQKLDTKVLRSRKVIPKKQMKRNRTKVTKIKSSPKESQQQLDKECPKVNVLQRFADPGGIFKCFLCPLMEPKFNSHVEFRNHVADSHVSENESGRLVLQCPSCPCNFFLRNMSDSGFKNALMSCLNHSIRKHDTSVPELVKVYKCEQCSFHTVNREIWSHHQKKHNSDQIPCESCGKMLKPGSLVNHAKVCEARATSRERFDCNGCRRSFCNELTLKTHVARVHNKQMLHLCSACPATFFAKTDLERHMYSRHKVNITSRQVSKCPICNFQTLQGSLMSKHMKNHEFGNFRCEFCNKVFQTQNRMKTHRRIHTSEKKHQCPHCEYHTGKKYHLDRHVVVRHLGTQLRCDQCSFSTVSELSLKRHYENVHGQTLDNCQYENSPALDQIGDLGDTSQCGQPKATPQYVQTESSPVATNIASAAYIQEAAKSESEKYLQEVFYSTL